ncbi:MAG: hypothetical protein OXS28_02415 [Gammaproteobacteria bacterium]|nr:hypothetical protein [Gammaproteobacteria bacterium]
MAKGNDGNYLQHCIEAEAAVRLAGRDTAGKLHIALTHGMRPFESFDKRGTGTRHELLLRKLMDANNKPQAEEPTVVKAYRETGASDTRYPNSAELLRAVIGSENLSGGITEMCSRKHKSLSSAWVNTNVKTACASWREEVHPEGILACPDDLQTPWLFSMDPMTYSERGNKDKNLNGPDIDILSDALGRYFSSGNPGFAAMFVYNVSKHNQIKFFQFVQDVKGCVVNNLTEHFEVSTSYLSLPHNEKGRRNLAGLIHSPQIRLASKFKSACIDIGLE